MRVYLSLSVQVQSKLLRDFELKDPHWDIQLLSCLCVECSHFLISVSSVHAGTLAFFKGGLEHLQALFLSFESVLVDSHVPLVF